MRRNLEWVAAQLRQQGMASFARASIRRLFGEKPIRGFERFIPFFDGKKGLEIGGPSKIFSEKSVLPVYDIAETIDCCNFSTQTVWEGEIKEGRTFRYSKDGVGRQFVSEGTDLGFLSSGSYDFVLSSHAIEHMGNPLKALYEWKRVLKNRGLLLLCAPDKERTFDHRRPTTSIEHLVEDFDRGTDERDLSHLLEILELHDLSMDPEAGTPEEFAERSRHNYENRCLHHHVFTPESLAGMVRRVGFDVLMVTTHPPYHIVIFARSNE